MTRTAKGLVAALAAVVGLMALISVASAAVSSLGIESATVAPGGSVTVGLNAEATAPGIGAFTVDVDYDDAKLDYVSCTGHASGLCNKTADGTVRFTGASATGISGSLELGTITFTAGSTEGTAALDVTIDTLTDPEGADITVSAGDGTITIAAPTPSPTPSPSPTAAPTAAPTATATPKSLPSTGGAASDGSGSSMALVLGTLGLAVLVGGVWAVSRTRRESL
jgi:septal ring-binding cell division protein DamX